MANMVMMMMVMEMRMVMMVNMKIYLFTKEVCVTSHKSELCSHYKSKVVGITLT